MTQDAESYFFGTSKVDLSKVSGMLHPAFLDTRTIKSLRGAKSLLKRVVKEQGLDSTLVMALNRLKSGDNPLEVVSTESDLGNPIINPTRSLHLSGNLGKFCLTEGILKAIITAPGSLASSYIHDIEKMYDCCPLDDATKYEIFSENLAPGIFQVIEDRILGVFT